MRFRAVMVFAAALLAVPGRASAAPIGTFEWVFDGLYSTGSTFNVLNESDRAFADIFVDLYAPEAADPFDSLNLIDLGAGEFGQSLDDLSLLGVPADISRVHLRFIFGSGSESALLGFDLFASALTGDPDLMAASIELTVADAPPPAPVPEPGTLVLLAAGLGALVVRRLRWPVRARGHEARSLQAFKD